MTRSVAYKLSVIVRLFFAMPMLIAGVLLCNPLGGLPKGVYGIASWIVGFVLVVYGLFLFVVTRPKEIEEIFYD